MSLFHKRQGQMDNHEVYFYTVTIHNFQHLLKSDELKTIVINSLQHLSTNKLAFIYGYVIMPNHIHLIWKTNDSDRNETVVGSFTKYTAHQFQKFLRTNYPNQLENYKVALSDRSYQFWKRDALAIPLSSLPILEQKLDYIHANPIQEKWRLSKFSEDYKWSSATFYQNGFDEFGILTHYRD